MYTEKDYLQLITDVEVAFKDHLAKSEGLTAVVLAKSEESNEVPAKEKKKEESEEKHESKEQMAEKPSEDKAPKEGENKEDSKGDGSAEKPEHSAPAQGDDHCDYDEKDMEDMHNMYKTMSKGELKAHHDAIKSAHECHGMEKCDGSSMMKSEVAVEVAPALVEVKSNSEELLKSEISALTAKNEELKKTLDTVGEILVKLTKRAAPPAKAITAIEVLGKTETFSPVSLSKAEINARLNQKVTDPSLTKSDKDAIKAYYLNSGTSINTISHLLK